MPLSIYLDDCTDEDLLITFLQHAGHPVITPRTAGTRGWDDGDHLQYAAQHGCTLLTKNPDDFRKLHSEWQAQGRSHGGILLVYQDNDVTKDMKPRAIVHAIGNLLASGLPIVNEIHTLNQWR